MHAKVPDGLFHRFVGCLDGVAEFPNFGNVLDNLIEVLVGLRRQLLFFEGLVITYQVDIASECDQTYFDLFFVKFESVNFVSDGFLDRLQAGLGPKSVVHTATDVDAEDQHLVIGILFLFLVGLGFFQDNARVFLFGGTVRGRDVVMLQAELADPHICMLV